MKASILRTVVGVAPHTASKRLKKYHRSSLAAATCGLVVAAAVTPAFAGWVQEGSGFGIFLKPMGYEANQNYADGDQGYLYWDDACQTWRTLDGKEVELTPRDVVHTTDADHVTVEIKGKLVKLKWVSCGPKLRPSHVKARDIAEGNPQGLEPTGPGVPEYIPWETMRGYIQVQGGVALPGTVTFTSPDDLKAGTAFSVAIGADVPLDLLTPTKTSGAPNNISVGGELMVDHTRREFVSFPGDYIDTTGIFGIGKASYTVNNRVQVYGGLGVGAFGINEIYPTGGNGFGPGYIAIAGGSLKLTDVISAIGEVDLEGSFGPIKASNGFDVQTSDARAMVGLRFNFNPPPPPP